MTTNIQRITDTAYSASLAAGRTEGKIEIRAQAIRYVPERHAIAIVTSRDISFLIPRQCIGALEDVPTGELGKLEVWPDGSAIELEDRDIQFSDIPGQRQSPMSKRIAWSGSRSDLNYFGSFTANRSTCSICGG